MVLVLLVVYREAADGNGSDSEEPAEQVTEYGSTDQSLCDLLAQRATCMVSRASLMLILYFDTIFILLTASSY